MRLASQSGTLPQVIPQLLARHESEREDWRSERRQTIAYFVVLAFIFSLLLLFLSGLIAPTFREMFEEFGMRPLWAFQTFDTYAGSLAANILTALLGWYVLVFILRQVGVTRWARRQLASRFSLGIRSQRSAHLLRLLSGTVTAGRPVEGALSTLARYHFDSRMRNQLLHARNEVEQGFTIEESLRNARLIDQQDAAALSMAKQGQFKGWLLGKIADRIESGVQHRAKVWTALLHPALICCFAAIVLWAALATFGILVQLISSLS